MTASGGCAECRDLLGPYVLSALEPDEAERVRAHLERCPECADEVRELARLPALLDLAGSVEREAERPPAELESAVLRAVSGDRADQVHEPHPPPGPAPRRVGDPARPGPIKPTRRSQRPWPPRRVLAVAAASALAGAGVTVAALALGGALGDGSDTSRVALRGSPLAPRASAEAVVRAGPSGQSVRLSVRGLEPTRGEAVYELWFGRPDGRVSAGTFRVRPDGTAEVRLTAAARPGAYRAIGVTREPDGLDPAGNGPNVLRGELG